MEYPKGLRAACLKLATSMDHENVIEFPATTDSFQVAVLFLARFLVTSVCRATNEKYRR